MKTHEEKKRLRLAEDNRIQGSDDSIVYWATNAVFFFNKYFVSHYGDSYYNGIHFRDILMFVCSFPQIDSRNDLLYFLSKFYLTFNKVLSRMLKSDEVFRDYYRWCMHEMFFDKILSPFFHACLKFSFDQGKIAKSLLPKPLMDVKDYDNEYLEFKFDSFELRNESFKMYHMPYPILYRTDKDAYCEINIDSEECKKLPSEFFKNPTLFIEEEVFIIEREQGMLPHSMGDLLRLPYDFTRVKKYKDIVFKRVDLNKVRYGLEEIELALKLNNLLKDFGDSRFKVQMFLGYVYDQGNITLLSKYVDCSNYCDIGGKNEEIKGIIPKLQEYLKPFGYPDINERNLLVKFSEPDIFEECTLIDFETKLFT